MEGLVSETTLNSLLEKLGEAFTWIKIEVKSFFKQLSDNLARGLLCVKSFVINCCEKLKQVLASTNGLIDAGVSRVSGLQSKMRNEPENTEEVTLLEELKKLVKKLTPLLSFIMEIPDQGWRRKAQIVTKALCLIQGLIELLDLGGKQPIALIIACLDGYLIFRKLVNKTPNNISILNLPQHKGKAAAAICFLLSLISSLS